MSVSLTITSGNVHLSGNPIEVIITASAPKDNHKLAVKVSCAALLSPVQIEEIEPTNLVAIHQISGLLNEPLPSVFEWPCVGKVSAYDALALVATVDCGEVWDDENGDRQESWAGVNQVIRVLNGQLRDYELAALNDANKTFKSEFIDGGRFLTNLPDYQKVSPDQKIKLWYLSRWMENHAGQLNLVVNTENNAANLPITQAVEFWPSGVFEFTVNPAFYGFAVSAGTVITGYTFWLSDAGGDISERRHFVVDNRPHETSIFGYYRNKFSAIESFWLHGSRKTSLKTENEAAYKPVAVGSGTIDGTLKTVSATGHPVWAINTGVKLPAEMKALRDLLESEEIWIIDPDNSSQLIPVFIPGNEFLLDDTMAEVQNLEITFQESNQR